MEAAYGLPGKVFLLLAVVFEGTRFRASKRQSYTATTKRGPKKYKNKRLTEVICILKPYSGLSQKKPDHA